MKELPWSWILVLCLLGSCVSRDKYNDVSYQVDSLKHELGLEKRLNKRLQAYVENIYYDEVETSTSYAESYTPIEPTPVSYVSETIVADSFPDSLDFELLLPPRKSSLDDISETKSQSNLNQEIAYPNMRIRRVGEDVVFTLRQQLVFSSGGTKLNEKGLKALEQIARSLRDQEKYQITVEGHTDSEEIQNLGQIKDNWDLSVLRSAEVVRALVNFGIPPHQLIAAGRSKFKPVARNNSSENKALNRRIEIILSPLVPSKP